MVHAAVQQALGYMPHLALRTLVRPHIKARQTRSIQLFNHENLVQRRYAVSRGLWRRFGWDDGELRFTVASARSIVAPDCFLSSKRTQ
jgi:hypothetical protein